MVIFKTNITTIFNVGNHFVKDDLGQLKNENYDIWKLGILFYKITIFGKSPYNDEKNEGLINEFSNSFIILMVCSIFKSSIFLKFSVISSNKFKTDFSSL